MDERINGPKLIEALRGIVTHDDSMIMSASADPEWIDIHVQAATWKHPELIETLGINPAVDHVKRASIDRDGVTATHVDLTYAGDGTIGEFETHHEWVDPAL